MPENHLFEYAVIRVVPRVEREEFINVGVILYCSAQKFLQARFQVNEDRLRSLCLKTDLAELQQYIASFEHICQGGAAGGRIGQLPMAERFRWLTATRSTIIQTSKTHPGLCPDAAEMFDRLFNQLVL